MTARLLSMLIAIAMLSADDLWAQEKAATTDPDHHFDCAFDPVLERESAQANYSLKQEAVERKLYQRALDLARIRRGARNDIENNEILSVPVVIHIIHLSSEPRPGDGLSNPPDEQILNGLDHLNAAFRNNDTYRKAGHNNHPAVQSVDVGIEFCLARQDINGNPTTGILRYESDKFSELNADLEDPEMQHWIDQQDEQAFPVTDYVHVWLVSKICRGTGTDDDPLNCNIGGYAYYPATYESTHNGIINLSYLWGTSTTGSLNHVHEFGHYLGLYHTFQGGCPNGDCLTKGDRVCDTPPDSRKSYYACGEPDNSCFSDTDDTSIHNPFEEDQDDLYENYMDYTSKYCQHTFTRGQADRMRSSLIEVRNQLLASSGCSEPGEHQSSHSCAESELLLLEEEIEPDIYDNAASIFAAGKVEDEGQLVLQAAESIHLLPGFRVGGENTLVASIRPCEGDNPPASDDDDDQSGTSENRPIQTDPQASAALKIAPNPVSDRANIQYYLPEKTEMFHLSLVDVNGRTLWKLNNEEARINGWQQTSFSARNLPSGLYVLLLRTENGLVSRQVMVE